MFWGGTCILQIVLFLSTTILWSDLIYLQQRKQILFLFRNSISWPSRLLIGRKAQLIVRMVPISPNRKNPAYDTTISKCHGGCKHGATWWWGASITYWHLGPYLMSVYVVQWGVWKFTHDCFLIYNHYCRDDLVLRNTVENYRILAFNWRLLQGLICVGTLCWLFLVVALIILRILSRFF